MFTLDGHMRFQLALGAQDEERFHTQKLREIILSRRSDGIYELAFMLVSEEQVSEASPHAGMEGAEGEIPEYIMVEEVQ